MATTHTTMWIRVALLCIAAAGITVGSVFFARADSKAITNRAVVDASASAQVVGQVSTALNEILSYSYATPDVAQQAAFQWLTGDAINQYHVLFTQLAARAPGQKLTFAAKVLTAGVFSLRGNTAQLLVFLDQRSTRASDHQSSVAAAQVQITAVRDGSRWQISELRPI